MKSMHLSQEELLRSQQRLSRYIKFVALAFVCAGFGFQCRSKPAEDPSTKETIACDEATQKKAQSWFDRATKEYRQGDMKEAEDSIRQAQKICDTSTTRLTAARVALAQLKYKEVVELLDDVESSEAASLRARAYWYSDDLAKTAEELTQALEDPSFKDIWAKPVRELAGAQGSGRKPFSINSGSTSLVELNVPQGFGAALAVSCEIDGQPTVALIATGLPEVVLDAKGRSKPSWVSIRFANANHSIEFRDVPALSQDLSQFNGQGTVTIGALLGINLLRRMHLTLDRRGDQIIVRSAEPPKPPKFTAVPVTYVRGGGMIIPASLRKEAELTASLWVDTASAWSLALPDASWRKLGVEPKNLTSFAGAAVGQLTNVRVGSLDLGQAVALGSVPSLVDKLNQFDLDIIGSMGVGFLNSMRVTLADGGRTLWLETDDDTNAVINPPISVITSTAAKSASSASSSTTSPFVPPMPSTSSSTR